MIFGTRNDDRFEFKLGTHAISICEEFKYLGIIFSKKIGVFTVLLNIMLNMEEKL